MTPFARKKKMNSQTQVQMQPKNANLRSRIVETLRTEAAWLLAAIVLFVTATLGRWAFDPTGLDGLIFGGYTLILCIALALVIGRKAALSLPERRPVESMLLVVYLAVYDGLLVVWRNKPDNLFTIWAFLVVIPAVFFWLCKHSLNSVGLGKQDILRGLATAIVVGLLWLPLLVYANHIESEPGKSLISGWEGMKSLLILLISFVASLLFAGFPEEFFFRGILQGSLTNTLRRPLRAILISSFLFAIYHLPFAFFVPTWASQGNLWFSLALVMTSQFLTGLLFGIVHWKSNSLIAPVLLHTLFDTFILYSSAQININIGT